MKRFTKKLIAFLGIFAVLLLTFDLLSATERFRGVFAALTDSSDYEEELSGKWLRILQRAERRAVTRSCWSVTVSAHR